MFLKKRYLHLRVVECSILVKSLVQLKNKLIQQGRATDCVDDLIIKVITCPLGVCITNALLAIISFPLSFLIFWTSMFTTLITGDLRPLWAIEAQFSINPNWASIIMAFLCVHFSLPDAQNSGGLTIKESECQSFCCRPGRVEAHAINIEIGPDLDFVGLSCF